MTYKLPEGWKEVKLGDVIDKQIDNRGRNPSEYLNYSEYPVIDNYLIKNERYPDLEKVKRYISKDTFENFLRGYVEKDDVIITLVGNGIGNVSMIPNNKCTIIQNTLGLRCNNLMDNSFLFYTLLYNQSEIVNFDRGSSQPSIRKTDLFRQRIKFPPLKEQEAIANTLSALDDKIENNNKIAKNLEAQAQAIFKHWFVDFEFPNEEGKPYKSSGGEMEESELGMIPKGWKIVELKDELEFLRGIEPGSKNYLDKKEDDNLPFYRVGEMIAKTNIYVKEDLLKDRIANKDDILVSFDGTVGRVRIGISGGYSTGIRKIFSKGNYFPKSFIYYLFKSNKMQDIINEYATGTTILHASKSIDYMYIPYNENIIKKFDGIFNKFFQKLVKIQEENQKLEELRDTLLPKLISGELRIPLD